MKVKNVSYYPIYLPGIPAWDPGEVRDVDPERGALYVGVPGLEEVTEQPASEVPQGEFAIPPQE